MDDGRQAPVHATRLLGWLTAGLLVAGAVSAGVVGGKDDSADRRVVAAAGAGLSGVDAPTTTKAPATTTTRAAGVRLTSSTSTSRR